MYSVTVERTQHAIGQGGFHSFRLQTVAGEFKVVYDCGGGTGERRTKIIKDVFSTTPLEQDWLVISHLDADHINGIATLEKEGVTFSNVFLPHANLPHSMFMMLLTTIAATPDAVTADQLSSIMVAGKLYGGAYGRAHMVIHAEQVPDGDLPGFDGLPNLSPADLAEPSHMLDENTRRLTLTSGRVTAFADAQSIYISDVDWQFRFYSREWLVPHSANIIWDMAVLRPLRDAINHLALLGNNNGRDFTEGIETALKSPVPHADATLALRQFVAKYPAIRKDISINALLKLLYKVVPDLLDYNSASLCMYSGPGNSPFSNRQHYIRQTNIVPSPLAGKHETRIVGWLGMGDAHLHNVNELTEFTDHYRRELRLLSTLMLPHHGSRHNYDADHVQLHGLLSSLPASPTPVLIAASDPAHKSFRHPHTQVVEIGNRYGNVHNVNLDWRSTFEESITTIGSMCCCWCS